MVTELTPWLRDVNAATLSEVLMAFAKCIEVSGCQAPC